jgi:hypothetical protein
MLFNFSRFIIVLVKELVGNLHQHCIIQSGYGVKICRDGRTWVTESALNRGVIWEIESSFCPFLRESVASFICKPEILSLWSTCRKGLASRLKNSILLISGKAAHFISIVIKTFWGAQHFNLSILLSKFR